MKVPIARYCALKKAARPAPISAARDERTD